MQLLRIIKLVSCPRTSLNKLFTLILHTGGRRYPDGFEIPGFRVAPRPSPGLPGMTIELYCEFLSQDTRSR